MKQKQFHFQAIAVAFVTITAGTVALMFGAVNFLKYEQIKRAYLVEKAKADAAAKVIDLCKSDCQDFDYEIDNSEVYWRYAQIADLKY